MGSCIAQAAERAGQCPLHVVMGLHNREVFLIFYNNIVHLESGLINYLIINYLIRTTDERIS